MPDEDQLFLRPRKPPVYNERHPTGRELEFIMARIAELPTRRELIHFGVWVACIRKWPANVGSLHLGMQLEILITLATDPRIPPRH